MNHSDSSLFHGGDTGSTRRAQIGFLPATGALSFLHGEVRANNSREPTRPT
ncbi:MAG TPA: hypothetical protein VGJ66_23995 [Pyrinomonadaceae bacterium]